MEPEGTVISFNWSLGYVPDAHKRPMLNTVTYVRFGEYFTERIRSLDRYAIEEGWVKQMVTYSIETESGARLEHMEFEHVR